MDHYPRKKSTLKSTIVHCLKSKNLQSLLHSLSLLSAQTLLGCEYCQPCFKNEEKKKFDVLTFLRPNWHWFCNQLILWSNACQEQKGLVRSTLNIGLTDTISMVCIKLNTILDHRQYFYVILKYIIFFY